MEGVGVATQRNEMDRRHFVKAAAAGAALAACGGGEQAAPAVHARPRIAWRLASSFPRGLDTIYGTAEILAERLAALSDGAFTIRPYPAGELVPGLQVMDAVQQRTVPVGHTASYYYTGKSPALAFDTAVPFGLVARQQAAWLYAAGGLELINEVLADFDIIGFPAGNTGAQWGGWFKRAVNSMGT
jgi:TRAP-type mannitol/chloroaromatic compound transport system substrate-binding protein